MRELEAGPAYYFAEEPEPARMPPPLAEDDAGMLHGGFEGLVEELPGWRPFLAVVDGERAVSVCRNVRITPEAHEAGVETLPEFRGMGYARDVVAGWALRVRSLGAEPL